MTTPISPSQEVPTLQATDDPLDSRVAKSFDFLQDATKQIIALATAILTFTITFLKDIAGSAGTVPRAFLTASWICLVASAIAGLFVLLNMTGILASPSEKPDVYRGSIRLLSGVQLFTFGSALIFALVFAVTWWPTPP